MNNIRYRAWDKKSKKMRQVVDIVFNTGFYLVQLRIAQH